MSLQVRPGYINPLTTMTNKKQGYTLLGKNSPGDKVSDLQSKQQEKLQTELEQVSEELQAAKNDSPKAEMCSSSEKTQGSFSAFSAAARSRVDTYEKSANKVIAPGVYQAQREQNFGYYISFIPYSE